MKETLIQLRHEMEKENGKKVWIRIILIPAAGLILLGLCFMLYYGIYMFIEYKKN